MSDMVARTCKYNHFTNSRHLSPLNMVRLSVLALLAAAQAASLEIFASNVHTSDRTNVGTLSISGENATFDARADLPAGGYVFSTDAFERFAYAEVENGLAGEFLVYLEGQEVEKLAFVPGGEGLTLRVAHVAVAPLPNLKPAKAAAAKKPAMQKVIKKKTVQTEDGESVVVEEEVEEEDTRSFMQKYWMYIVPLLLLMLLMPEPEEEKKA